MHPRKKLHLFFTAVILIAIIASGATRAEAACAVAFCGTSGSITLSDTITSESPYPSTIVVSGVAGTVSKVTVDVNLNFSRMLDLSMMLVAPDGTVFDMLAGVGPAAFNGAFTVDDVIGSAHISRSSTSSNLTNGGTFLSSAATGINTVAFPGAAGTPGCPAQASGFPANSPNLAGPPGTGTLAIFNGKAPNGNWNLCVISSANGGGAAGSMTWSLNITSAVSTQLTTTTVQSSLNPSFFGDNVTFTATVKVGATPVNGVGQVTFKEGASTLSGPTSINGSGQAAFSTSTLSEGSHIITASYHDSTAAFGDSSASVTQVVNYHSTNPATGQYCNPGKVSIPSSGLNSPVAASVYPSQIFVPTLTGSLAAVTVNLNSLTTTDTTKVNMLLVGPGGREFIFLSGTGSTAGISGLNLTLDDNAANSLPTNGTAYGSGTFKPTDTAVRDDTFPATAPAGPYNYASPHASPHTFTDIFSGADMSVATTWTLYFVHHIGGDTATLGAQTSGADTAHPSWCLNFTTSGDPSTTTAVTSSSVGNQSFTGQNVTFTAHVTKNSDSSNVTSGTVTFKEGGTTLAGPNALDGTGHASFITNALSEGTHTITAFYNGSPGNFNLSNGSTTQIVDVITTVNGTSYCNTGGITIPAPATLSGPVAPYPSHIHVGVHGIAALPGTIQKVTLTLNGFGDVHPNNLQSLLIGPNGLATQSLDFFSGEGGVNAVTGVNVTFDDAAANLATVLTSNTTASFRPTSASAANTYPAPAPSGPFNFAAPAGAATFASIFNSVDPNGTWSLYMTQPTANANSGSISNWCLNFTENAPVLSAVKSHSGNFSQGQQGAHFSITVTNNGPGSTVGQVTVTDVLSSGLTPAVTPGTGTDWSCQSVAQVITCTNSDGITEGNSYPTLTLNADVATNAANTTNQATVSGGGSSGGTNSNIDSITVTPAPILSVSKAHTGTFTQAQTSGQWNVTVTNTAAAGSATNGTTTVQDTMPAGFTVADFGTTDASWSCGSVTNVVTCTSTLVVTGGNSFPVIHINVSVPANSPTSVTNSVKAYGGGDLTHTNVNNAAAASDGVSVGQTPASISASTGTPQSATINTAFTTNLQATVLDAAGQPIQGLQVTFTAPNSGASGTFPVSSLTGTGNTNASGIATAPAFTANATAGGPYNVVASVSGLGSTASFALTNVGTTSPTVVSYSVLFGSQSYNVIGSARNRLPWQIAGIQVVFSKPITSGNSSSLGGVTPTGFSGLGTNTLTWTINAISLGNFATTLSGSGVNALKDSDGNGLTGGAGFSQALKVLWADFNDDGVVNASDFTLVNNARSAPYNILADMNGDGVVDTTDANIVRTKNGTSLP